MIVLFLEKTLYNYYMKITNVLFSIAIVVLIAWVIGMVFKFAAWILNGLVGVAAIIVIIGLIAMFIQSKRNNSNDV